MTKYRNSLVEPAHHPLAVKLFVTAVPHGPLGHVTAQLVNLWWRRVTTVVRKSEYVTGGHNSQ